MRVRARAHEHKGGDNDDIVVQGQHCCHHYCHVAGHCHCIVGGARMRVRVGARVHEDEGKGKDKGDNNNNIVAQGQQRCSRHHHHRVTGCTRTRVRVRVRVRVRELSCCWMCEDEGQGKVVLLDARGRG